MAFGLKFQDAPLGHEITGVDLSQPLDDSTFAQVENAYDTYGVVLIRDQHLTPEQQLAYSRRYGALERFVIDKYNHPQHPEIFVVSNIIDETGRPIGMADAGRYWHTDMWHVQVPPRGSILYALEVPHDDQGQPLGDTCFTSTAAAYDALPEDFKRRIEGKICVFSTARSAEFRARTTPQTEQAKQSAADRAGSGYKELRHPIVQTHPRSGRKHLYCTEGGMDRIEGLDQAESDEIIATVLAQVLKPEFIYRHHWKVGDMIMWDNRSAMHKAIGDFDLPRRRLMYRTTLSAASFNRQSAAA